jgi:hypothetical protein
MKSYAHAGEALKRPEGQAGRAVETIWISAGGFFTLAPAWWPRTFEPPTRNVVERVERGLGRLL